MDRELFLKICGLQKGFIDLCKDMVEDSERVESKYTVKSEVSGLEQGSIVKVKTFKSEDWFFRKLVGVENDGTCICEGLGLQGLVKYSIWEPLTDCDLKKLVLKEE